MEPLEHLDNLACNKNHHNIIRLLGIDQIRHLQQY